ncbi:hypothetical protein RvY_19287 [Ramazzottius varieornatus]|uniref:Thyrotropin-releasing hormone receptor n=1 Tax=Ramazzottius varieornatus TaxID=947166 RepID=A0A1D1W8Y5_RAMVA|nr:hypothetical protein RvY_19287 [Ramazzottius varieornatus]
MDNYTNTSSPASGEPPVFAPDYRITATVLHSIIFLLGLFGNILVVMVVRRNKNMHIPTYTYLVSLAFADLLVVISVIPEAIVSYHLYANEWIYGDVGCSLKVFLDFMAINASSLSIMAFTVERYIAICKPLKAKTLCTQERAKKIILGLWLVSIASAIPWLGLTVVKLHPRFPVLRVCTFRVAPDKYVYIFGSDMLLFYFIPLTTATVLYLKIGLALRRLPPGVSRSNSHASFRNRAPLNAADSDALSNSRKENGKVLLAVPVTDPEDNGPRRLLSIRKAKMDGEMRQSRIKVVQMLVVIVVTFAVLWLPYRGISLYNCLAPKPILNKWVMLFAKTCIFINSSINPILYNVMSKRFRQAFLETLSCCKHLRNKALQGSPAIYRDRTSFYVSSASGSPQHSQIFTFRPTSRSMREFRKGRDRESMSQPNGHDYPSGNLDRFRSASEKRRPSKPPKIRLVTFDPKEANTNTTQADTSNLLEASNHLDPHSVPKRYSYG